MIQLDKVSKKLGIFELKDISFSLPAGYICGIAGRNGAGKTTLLHLLSGLYQPDSGAVMIFDSRYDTQEKQIHDSLGVVLNEDLMMKHLNLEKNGDYFGTYYSGYQKEQLLSYLKQFGLEKNRKFGKLSKGEKLKYQFAFALSCNPKLLILDEPTNDLDIRTLTILEDYLDNYDGIVITVSHDRYFLDRVVNRIFAFEEDGKICQYEGGYTDYVNRLAEEGKVPAGHILDAKNDTTTSVEKENQTSSMDTWKRERKLKFSYKEQREYETIDDDIAGLEEKIEKLDNDIMANATNSGKLNELTKEKETAEALLEEKMDRWVYLNDLAEQIEAQNNK